MLRFAFIVAFPIVSGGIALGQAVDISGLVLDTGGRPVAGARVALPTQGLSATTDATGRYRLLRPGTWLPSGPNGWKGPSFNFSGRYFTLAGRRLPGDAPASGDHHPPDLGKRLLPVALRRVAAAADTLEVVALGWRREDRALTALQGTQDFRLQALPFADVPYKAGPGLSAYEIERWRLDVHVPEGTGRKWPVYVHLHGGGLHGGDKNEGWFAGDNFFSRKLMEEGVLIFSPNYRLGYDPDLPKTGVRGKFPDYLHDAAAAVAWVRKHLETYGGDPQKFFVGGYSGGSWLAMMLAMDTSYYRAIGFPTAAVKGYLAFSVQTYTYGQVAAERGISDRSVTDASLMGHIRRQDIPMHVFVGGLETQRIADNQAWVKAMRDAGTSRLLFSIQPGRDHKQIVTTLGDAADDTRAKVMAFFRDDPPAPKQGENAAGAQVGGEPR